MKINFLAVTVFLLCALFVQPTKAQTGQNNNSAPTDEKVYRMNEVDQKVEITRKPEPSTDGSCQQSAGLTSVWTVFHKSGKVTKAQIKSSSGCRQFDENALKAARGIKFKPAVKDQQAVTVATIVEYQYRVY